MGRQTTILVIDDNTTSRNFASRALTGQYAVKPANNAMDGLEKTRRPTFWIISKWPSKIL